MTTDDVQDAAALREAMTTEVAARCAQWGFPLSKQIETALRTVPRHLFAPEASLEKAYALDIVEVKRSEHGVLVSTMSAPDTQAMQLAQADIDPGMRILEIGSGGYFASLLAELVGPTGHVTTLDIDADVADRARDCLDAAGYERVHTVTADGEYGWEADAPYDRIMVTVGAYDIPPAWREQLELDGRLVVPLRMKGISRMLALEPAGDHLVAVSAAISGFVWIQGEGANDGHLWLLAGKKVGLRIDDGNLEQPSALDGVLAGEPVAAWSGVTVGRSEPFPDLALWMANALPGFGHLLVDASEPGPDLTVEPGGRRFPFAAVDDDGDSVGYLSIRPAAEGFVEMGAHGYGPHASQIAEAIVAQVRVWDRDYRDCPSPAFAVWPLGTPESDLPKNAMVIHKRHSLITISWPDASARSQAAPPTP